MVKFHVPTSFIIVEIISCHLFWGQLYELTSNFLDLFVCTPLLLPMEGRCQKKFSNDGSFDSTKSKSWISKNKPFWPGCYFGRHISTFCENLTFQFVTITTTHSWQKAPRRRERQLLNFWKTIKDCGTNFPCFWGFSSFFLVKRVKLKSVFSTDDVSKSRTEKVGCVFASRAGDNDSLSEWFTK